MRGADRRRGWDPAIDARAELQPQWRLRRQSARAGDSYPNGDVMTEKFREGLLKRKIVLGVVVNAQEPYA